MVKNTYFYALGRRKTSTARVRLQSGSGKIVINNQDVNQFIGQSKYLLNKLMTPFAVLDLESNKYDISAKVSGGGTSGQIDAIRLGIARAFAVMNEDFKGNLKRAELLGRDPRAKERKKFGLKGARKQRQFTKR